MCLKIVIEEKGFREGEKYRFFKMWLRLGVCWIFIFVIVVDIRFFGCGRVVGWLGCRFSFVGELRGRRFF